VRKKIQKKAKLRLQSRTSERLIPVLSSIGLTALVAGRSILVIWTTICLILVSGCEGKSEVTDACSDLSLVGRVLYGTQCSPESSSPVVELKLFDKHGDEFGRCTGTVIAADRILTAAHCVVDDVKRIRVSVGGENISSSHFVAHPDSDISDNQINSPGKDVAVIHLERETEVSPLPILSTRNFTKGESFSVFGYGLDQDGDSSELRSGTMEADEVNSDFFESEHTDTSSGICYGDSGGPAIAQVDQGNDLSSAIVGVASALSPVGLGGIPFLPPPPVPGPFPIPLPFGNSEKDCEVGAVNFHANLQNDSVLRFIEEQSPNTMFR